MLTFSDIITKSEQREVNNVRTEIDIAFGYWEIMMRQMLERIKPVTCHGAKS